jgi:hypothetical protein
LTTHTLQRMSVTPKRNNRDRAPLPWSEGKITGSGGRTRGLLEFGEPATPKTPQSTGMNRSNLTFVPKLTYLLMWGNLQLKLKKINCLKLLIGPNNNEILVMIINYNINDLQSDKGKSSRHGLWRSFNGTIVDNYSEAGSIGSIIVGTPGVIPMPR